MKVRPVGAELFHAEKQTEGRRDEERYDEANSRFSKLLRTGLKKHRILFAKTQTVDVVLGNRVSVF
jgi:hypothetical protein